MNTPGYREIERKFAVPMSLKKAHDLVMELYGAVPKEKILDCETRDEYWEVPGKGQFLRLRHSWGASLAGDRREIKELTAKAKDRGSNLNRLEINTAVESILDMRALLRLVLGNPMGTITKREYVYFLERGVVVSLSEVNGKAVYLEVEGPNVASISGEFGALESKLSPIAPEGRSLFEIFIAEKP